MKFLHDDDFDDAHLRTRTHTFFGQTKKNEENDEEKMKFVWTTQCGGGWGEVGDAYFCAGLFDVSYTST